MRYGRFAFVAMGVVALVCYWAIASAAEVATAWVDRYNGPLSSIDAAHALQVDDAGNVLDLTWTHAQHIRVYYDLPDMFDDNVTYEIIADFTGTFTPVGGTAVTIAGNGFADWGSPPFPEQP